MADRGRQSAAYYARRDRLRARQRERKRTGRAYRALSSEQKLQQLANEEGQYIFDNYDFDDPLEYAWDMSHENLPTLSYAEYKNQARHMLEKWNRDSHSSNEADNVLNWRQITSSVMDGTYYAMSLFDLAHRTTDLDSRDQILRYFPDREDFFLSLTRQYAQDRLQWEADEAMEAEGDEGFQDDDDEGGMEPDMIEQPNYSKRFRNYKGEMKEVHAPNESPSALQNQPYDRTKALLQRKYFFQNTSIPGVEKKSLRGRVVNMFLGNVDVQRLIEPFVAANGYYPVGPEMAATLHTIVNNQIQRVMGPRLLKQQDVWNNNAYIRIGVQSSDNAMFSSTKLVKYGEWLERGLDLINDLVDKARESGRDIQVDAISVIMLGAPVRSGGGRKRRIDESEAVYEEAVQEERKENLLFCGSLGRKTVIKSHIFYDDVLCAQRSLILLAAYKDRISNPSLYKKLRRPKVSIQGSQAFNNLQSMAIELSQEAGVFTDEPVSLSNLPKFAEALSKRRQTTCHIIVVDGSQSMCPIYRTLQEKSDEDLLNVEWFVLLYRNEHFDGVTKIHSLMFGQRYFCYSCMKTYSHKEHYCKNSKNCRACGFEDLDHMETRSISDIWKSCDVCFRRFPSEACFNHHMEREMCHLSWKCQSCKKSFRRSQPEQKPNQFSSDPLTHVCSDMWCSNCNLFCSPDHHCYMKIKQPLANYERYVFADFETDQSSGEHIVNLAITIEYDGTQWPAFSNISEWVQYMLLSQHDGKTFIFHNGRGFDFHPIVNRLITIGKNPQCIMAGRKIMYMELAQKKKFNLKTGRRFVDSLNFLTMPLASFTKTFNLATKKGYYCHYFNTSENLNYKGPIPDKQTFGYDDMPMEKRKNFDEWYVERLKEIWDNKFELLDYCFHDVKLLREGCLAFRHIVVSQCNEDPFLQKTLSSSAMNIFRTSFLKENVIAALPLKTACDLRTAFKGGRVEAFKMHYKCQDDERIAYVDFTSLYPFCNSRCEYPVGHPSYVENPGEELWQFILNSKLSVFEVDVECPQDLYAPLLHSQKDDGILMFDLLPKKKIRYTNLELVKALKLGYKITTVYNIYFWDKSCVGIFSEYMKKFLKLKQEAAGWPSEAMTDYEKEAYVLDYKEKEGIDLDFKNIQKNDGMYKTAKFYLNALWGKFAQRNPDVFTRTSFIHGTDEGIRQFNTLLSEGMVSDCYVVNENTCIVKSKSKADSPSLRLGSVNIAIGIFTTAHARLKLYNEFIEPTGQRILYCDTDSCIFVYNKKHEDPSDFIRLGNYLGDPTSEIGAKTEYDEESWIDEFASGGPKHYGYSVKSNNNSSKENVKVKGLRFGTFKVQNNLTFKRIKNIITSIHNNAMVFYTKEFRIDEEHRIKNIDTRKTYQVNFTKRQVDFRNSHIIDTKPWTTENELKEQFIKQFKIRQKRDEFIAKKACALYLLTNLTISDNHEESYLVAISNFETEGVREFYKTLITPEEYEMNNINSAIIDFVSYVDSSLTIHYKCESSVFDNFNLCSTVKHVY